MARPVTLFTGQWADLPLATLAEKAAGWGYEGLELGCWGDHMDVRKGAESKEYCDGQKAILEANGLEVWAISNHLAGQLVLDNIEPRHMQFCGDEAITTEFEEAGYITPEIERAVHEWAIEEMKCTARAARNLGVEVVCGFTGSSIWHMIYSFPPVDDADIDAGFELLLERWDPILDVFEECGVMFGLEVHPTEIAYDIVTAARAIDALGDREEFGFNFDPSHLQWQSVDPVCFIKEFSDRIYHVHMKDCAVTLNGRAGILSSHLNFGDPNRGWDFRSLGRGDVEFEEIIRTLNQIGYNGPLSVEWEDSGMDREHGAAEACKFVKEIDFPPSEQAFDAAFDE
ncbi:MAG: sugar phosphate isomerase/epimerase [Candidatus Aenigmarchaeota archaeon]|nr:sugar phosphate isomerase/epimerase [Candidatus Aenigmarchaeota archaeon]